MKETRVIMTMPIVVDIVGAHDVSVLNDVFAFFTEVERRFSFFRDDSEVAAFNRGAGVPSAELQDILTIAEKTKQETDGYFDIVRADGRTDPSGITKGWAIKKAADIVRAHGCRDFLIDAGGDIHTEGRSAEGEEWRIGIRDPFDFEQIVKVVVPRGRGVATSGSSMRGGHIYDPRASHAAAHDVASITVIGPDILEADRLATAAFAMGKRGAAFIESLPGFEAYMIDTDGVATMTSHFNDYVATI